VQAADADGGEIETLRSARAAVDDRDIVWFVNTGANLVSNQDEVSSSLENEIKALLDQFRSDERVLLIGKDGGMKSREPSLDLDAIFRRIDRMPMRMREMRSD
jgi:streptogramin lyase